MGRGTSSIQLAQIRIHMSGPNQYIYTIVT